MSDERRKSVPVMRRLNLWVWTELLVALVLLIVVLAGWWMTDRREMEAEMRYLLSVHGEQLESRLGGLVRTMDILLEKEGDLALMGAASEAERQHAMIRLRNALQSTLRIDPSSEWGVMAGSVYRTDVQAGGNAPSLAQKERMRADALQAAERANGLSAGWEETVLSGEAFFRRYALRPQQAIHLYVRRSTLMGQIGQEQDSALSWELLSGGKRADGSAQKGSNPWQII